MSDEFEDDKPQKPKKFAEITVTIWDDAELEMDCVRFKQRESGRGAPRKIILEDKKVWMDDVDSQVMSKFGLHKFIKDELKFEEPEDDSEFDEEE